MEEEIRMAPIEQGQQSLGMPSGSQMGRRYAKLSPRLREAYLENLADPDVLSLREEIAIIKAKLDELIADASRIDPKIIKLLERRLAALADAADEYEFADDKTIPSLIWSIQQTLSEIRAGQHLWNEFFRIQEHLRRMTESETKLILAKSHSLSFDKALAIAKALAESVCRNVSSGHERAAVLRDIDAMLNMPLEFAGEIISASGGRLNEESLEPIYADEA